MIYIHFMCLLTGLISLRFILVPAFRSLLWEGD